VSRKHHRPWAPTVADRALAARLGPGAAFLPVGEGYAGLRGGALELALAVWERLPGRAHAALRRRIRLTGEPTELDRAVTAVVAHRLAAVVGEDAPIEVPCEDLSPWLDRARVRAREARVVPGADRLPADLTGFVRDLVPAGEDRRWAERDRPVVAVLAGPDRRIRWAARNAGGSNRVLHAECALVLGLDAPLEAGSTVLVSLQPCRMCAALLAARAEGPIAVRWLEPDPGRLARDTALQRLGWEGPLTSS
jgi:tRNA(Arg) A34 adenosine deaminase TadA